MALDFTQYLSERLGLNESETTAVLGTWLKEYEPLSSANDLPSRASSKQTAESAPLARSA